MEVLNVFQQYNIISIKMKVKLRRKLLKKERNQRKRLSDLKIRSMLGTVPISLKLSQVPELIEIN